MSTKAKIILKYAGGREFILDVYTGGEDLLDMAENELLEVIVQGQKPVYELRQYKTKIRGGN